MAKSAKIDENKGPNRVAVVCRDDAKRMYVGYRTYFSTLHHERSLLIHIYDDGHCHDVMMVKVVKVLSSMQEYTAIYL